MTINEAHKICEDFYRLSNPNDEDRFLVTEALDYLITETKDPGYMLELGGLYYEQKQFELARKYYELAAEYDNTAALLCLDERRCQRGLQSGRHVPQRPVRGAG